MKPAMFAAAIASFIWVDEDSAGSDQFVSAANSLEKTPRRPKGFKKEKMLSVGLIWTPDSGSARGKGIVAAEVMQALEQL